MKEGRILGDDLPLPPECLFERLAQIPDYHWDTTIEPSHSSYDNWHVTGVKLGSATDSSSSSSSGSSFAAVQPSGAALVAVRSKEPLSPHHNSPRVVVSGAATGGGATGNSSAGGGGGSGGGGGGQGNNIDGASGSATVTAGSVASTGSSASSTSTTATTTITNNAEHRAFLRHPTLRSSFSDAGLDASASTSNSQTSSAGNNYSGGNNSSGVSNSARNHNTSSTTTSTSTATSASTSPSPSSINPSANISTSVPNSSPQNLSGTTNAHPHNHSHTHTHTHNHNHNHNRPNFPISAAAAIAARAASSSSSFDQKWCPVIARVSSNVVRLEREFHMITSFIKHTDPDCKYTIRPIDIIRLAPQPGDNNPLIATLYEYYGENYLKGLVPFGPAVYRVHGERKLFEDRCRTHVSLSTFFSFAIGACECLERLHSSLKAIHGEIRADAFHFNENTGQVRLFNQGNGARSFDNALGEGWITLSRELGVENKLQFIAPEQTGRLPIEPDTRTDIYALGVLFYSMLAGHPAFNGYDPVEIVQNVLSKKLAPLSTKREDMPEALSAVVEKMTQKQMDDRYHTISSVKQDLQNIRALVNKGDTEGLANFAIGEGDVSSFFTLPAEMIGRGDHFDQILSVVHKAHRRLQASITANLASMQPLYALSSGLVTPSESRYNGVDMCDASTDSESNHNTPSTSRSENANAGGENMSNASGSNSGNYTCMTCNNDNCPASPHHGPASLRKKSSIDPRVIRDATEQNSISPRHNSLTPFETLSVMERKKAHTKYRHGGRCEVITISGASGIGKTDLLTRLQPEIRKHGYACVARLDRGRREPFGPFIRVMASLLRQVFSERDITTSYHAAIRAVLQPTWSTLHQALKLPEQLIYPAAIDPIIFSQKSSELSVVKEAETSPPPTAPIILSNLGQTGTRASEGGEGQPQAAKLVRFADTFVDVLRALSLSKLFCLCLDDVQYADAESIHILKRIVDMNVRCVLVLTSGREDMLSDSLKMLFTSGNDKNITNIRLEPLNDEEVLDYVAATLHQPARKVLTPLASVIQAMSRGNPFYIRLILETCYRKECIYYHWEECRWQYDVDRILKECPTPELHDPHLGTDFIAKAFGDLRSEGRSILLWASMLGNPFSFSFVVKLLSGEFLNIFNGHMDDLAYDGRTRLVQPQIDVVTAGLQYLLQCGVIIPGETDDEYRFAHDHYSRALSIMTSQENREKMHFVIALTIMSIAPLQNSIYSCARHISLAAPLIKRTVHDRKLYRDALHQAARTASQSEAKPTALEYLETCIFLLQDDAWNPEAEDVFYEETRDIYLETAELLEHLRKVDQALEILDLVFKKTRTPLCKVRAWLLKAEIIRQGDDCDGALAVLFEALDNLGVKIHQERDWAECDQLWSNLSAYLSKTELTTLFGRSLTDDVQVQAIGSILRDAITISYYSDPKIYLVLIIEMVNQYIFRGAFAQSAFICLHASTIALGRYMNTDLGLKLADMLNYCKEQVDDPWTDVIGTAIYNSFLDHMRRPIAHVLSSLEYALEAAYLSGDHNAIMQNTLAMAHARLCLGHDMAELDAMMTLIPGRSDRLMNHRRNMVYVLALRQFARSMQGKTFIDFPEHIFSDNDHDAVAYTKDLQADGAFTQSMCVYRGTQIISLFLYGYLEEAMKIGYEMIEHIPYVFVIRVSVTVHFIFAAALLVYHLENPNLPTFNEHLEQARQSKAVVDYFRSACDTNYGMWSMILDGLLHEVAGDIGISMRYFEAALDHVQSNGFALEEGMILELQADSLLRGGAKSAAQALVLRSISSWNRIGASGKAKQLHDKHQWLLHMSPPYRTNDVGCQTVDSLLNNPTRAASQAVETSTLYRQVEEERKASNDSDDGGSFSAPKEKPSPVELDVIDHYNILEVSQIISSQLEIGNLLPKMVNIILESCSGSELAVVITEFGQDNWCVSASADRESGVRTFQDGAETREFDSKIALNITHYTLRTREQVLVSNVLEDERFLNVSEAYAAQYPEGKSIIALPIVQADKLLGAIHIEGKPQTFTQRNFTVLRLICNQIGISLANAILFAEANKISAANAAMVEAQKLALAHAREAEQKAKFAEAKARRNVKLKEDAAKAKSIFLANISHDLRTPMNGVIGLSELLKETQLDRQQDGYVESIRVCADTLLTLINDILDFSKLEAGKMKISAVPINLRGSIAEVVRALRYTHRDRGLKTIEDLEKIDPNLVVVSDPVRLHQIFMNLLSNSYKFTPKGSVTVRAEAKETPEGKVNVTCIVADTGIGIGQEQMARLFRPFSQADSSTERSYGGSGLGLSICKAIIENVLGGKISLQSEPGAGTTVTFELVFNKAVIGTQAQISWTRELAPGPRPVLMGSIVPELRFIPRSEIRVCIAEDNPINQKIAVTFVRNLGLNSEAFSNGQEAVDALRNRSKEGKPFHLVLMDVQMPVLDGYNATRLIREDEDPHVNNVLVIAMTASAIEGDKEKCIDAGMNNYLAKPVRSDVLKAMLDNYLAPPERGHPKRPTLRRPATAPTAQEVQSDKEQDKQDKASGIPPRLPMLSRKSLSNGEALELYTIAHTKSHAEGQREVAESQKGNTTQHKDTVQNPEIFISAKRLADRSYNRDDKSTSADRRHNN